MDDMGGDAVGVIGRHESTLLSDAVSPIRLSSLATGVVSDEGAGSRRSLEDCSGLRGRGKTLFVVGVTIGTAAPGSHVKCNEGVQLDQAMEVAENDGEREVDEIGRVAAEQSNKLDNLGEGKHEDELGPEGPKTSIDSPVGGGPPASSKEERVDGESERGEGCKVQSVGAPRLLSNVEWLVKSHQKILAKADRVLTSRRVSREPS